MKWIILLLFLSSVALAFADCGIRLSQNGNATLGRHKRIVGGNLVTTTGRWPWQVLLHIRGNDERNMCGGTVLSDRWILTAAHCVRHNVSNDEVTVKDIVVMAEVTNTSSDMILESFLNKHTTRVSKAIPHANFSLPIMTDDIALLELESPLQLDQFVSPICLPSGKQEVPHDGQAVAIGFGTANTRGTNETFLDGNLRESIVPIVKSDICEKRWKNSKYINDTTVSSWENLNIICAGSMGHDAGKEDSGGPLMMKAIDGRWFQIGVTSFGDESIEGDTIPGGYTDVREYCEWISETTRGGVKCQETVVLQDVEIK